MYPVSNPWKVWKLEVGSWCCWHNEVSAREDNLSLLYILYGVNDTDLGDNGAQNTQPPPFKNAPQKEETKIKVTITLILYQWLQYHHFLPLHSHLSSPCSLHWAMLKPLVTFLLSLSLPFSLSFQPTTRGVVLQNTHGIDHFEYSQYITHCNLPAPTAKRKCQPLSSTQLFMCQLMGMNCAALTDFTFSFRGFAMRGGNTDVHSHGWGLCFYDGRFIKRHYNHTDWFAYCMPF